MRYKNSTGQKTSRVIPHLEVHATPQTAISAISRDIGPLVVLEAVVVGLERHRALKVVRSEVFQSDLGERLMNKPK